MKFLIVDDDPAILKFTEQLLKFKNFEVVACENALEAIQTLGDLSFDIMITDATMPAYSGFDLIRTTKKREDLDYLTIAMLTGRSDKSDIEQAVELGVDDYIVKPIDPELFLEKVDRLVLRHKKKSKQKPTLMKSNAIMSVPVTVTRLTDIGVTVEGPYPLTKGVEVEIDCQELKDIGIKKNKFRSIFNSESRHQSKVMTELLLLNLTEDEQKLLIQWSQKSTKKKVS